jgi:hypothetical protein
MKSLPLPALAAALATVIALPFSAAAAATFLVTTGLALVIHADYNLRQRRVRLPRLTAAVPVPAAETVPFCYEPNRLAA